MQFHAAPPAGHWLNDPNALFHDEQGFHLFAQHAADSSGVPIGWGAFDSSDAVHWTWRGRVVEPDAEGRQAYSGSVAIDHAGRHIACLTRHDGARSEQSQQWLVNGVPDAEAAPEPSGRDCRDPFILSAAPGSRAVIVARPCNWNDWRAQPASHLEIWRETDAGLWRETGRIGPWSEPGVLWEVPQLFEVGGKHVLIVSLVDRRDGRADCSVRYWIGRFADDAFVPAPNCPPIGRLLDLGPDFYAPVLNCDRGWPRPARALVAWASNWDYARRILLPEGSAGGALSLVREIELSSDGTSLQQAPLIEGGSLHELSGSGSFAIEAGEAAIDVTRHECSLEVRVRRPGFPDHIRNEALPDGAEWCRLRLFHDAPLLEIFLEPAGLSLTAMLPDLAGGAPIVVRGVGTG